MLSVENIALWTILSRFYVGAVVSILLKKFDLFSEPEKEVDDGSKDGKGSIRDPNVSEEIWQELELAKMMEEMERNRIRLELEESRR